MWYSRFWGHMIFDRSSRITLNRKTRVRFVYVLPHILHGDFFFLWNKIFSQPTVKYFTYINQKCYFFYDYSNWGELSFNIQVFHVNKPNTSPEMQLTVGPRGQNFRGSGKCRLCVRPNDRQTFLLLGAVKNQISVGPGYLLDP